MDNHIQILKIEDWVVSVKIPSLKGPHPIMVLLHGWRGDENVMWIFARKIPKNYLIISPRAIYPALGGGYSWVNRAPNGFSTIEHFRPAVELLRDFLALRPGAPNQNFNKVDFMGFSQGAALAYSFALLYPETVRFIAGLAGFVPEGSDKFINKTPLKGKKFFISHGTNDQIIPINKAREGVTLLEKAGGEITFCEDNVGHKLGASCLRGLGKVLKNLDS